MSWRSTGAHQMLSCSVKSTYSLMRKQFRMKIAPSNTLRYDLISNLELKYTWRRRMISNRCLVNNKPTHHWIESSYFVCITRANTQSIN